MSDAEWSLFSAVFMKGANLLYALWEGNTSLQYNKASDINIVCLPYLNVVKCDLTMDAMGMDCDQNKKDMVGT